MILRVDESGRITVPKTLQIRLGLEPDREVEVVEMSEGMLLRPARRKSALARPDGLWVHQGAAQPNFPWQRVVRSVRERRLRSLL